MNGPQSVVVSFVQRWWFALTLVVVLVVLAVMATPSGQALAGNVVQVATATYYKYLAVVFGNNAP